MWNTYTYTLFISLILLCMICPHLPHRFLNRAVYRTFLVSSSHFQNSELFPLFFVPSWFISNYIHNFCPHLHPSYPSSLLHTHTHTHTHVYSIVYPLYLLRPFIHLCRYLLIFDSQFRAVLDMSPPVFSCFLPFKLSFTLNKILQFTLFFPPSHVTPFFFSCTIHHVDKFYSFQSSKAFLHFSQCYICSSLVSM